jgi:hypothetical protein
MAKKYVLNAAVMTSTGTYKYEIIDDKTAQAWFAANPDWISMIGYPEAIQALKTLCGISVPLNRVSVDFEDGDEALVFRLSHRVDPGRKGKLGIDYQIQNHEFGILRFIAA